MICNKCKNQVDVSEKNCGKCGNLIINNINELSEDNQLVNYKKIKKLNLVSCIAYLLLTVCLFIFLVYMAFSESYYALIIIFGALIFGGMFYSFNLVLLNFKNIKLINIIEQKNINGLENWLTGFFLLNFIFAFVVSKDFNIFFILIALICLILFIVSIIKSKLIKKIHHSEREKNTYIKYNLVFGTILAVLIFIPLVTPLNGCNKKYKLDDNELKSELKDYKILSEKMIDYNATGSLTCRSTDTQTIVGFYDKYNNYIKVEVLDSNKGGIRKDLTMSSISDVQFVNNILVNKYLKVEVDNENVWSTTLHLDDNYLASLFDYYIFLSDNETNVPLYKYDIKESEYKLNFSLHKKDDSSVSIYEVKEYLENYFNELFDIVGSDHLEKISVRVDEGNYELKFLNKKIYFEYNDNF